MSHANRVVAVVVFVGGVAVARLVGYFGERLGAAAALADHYAHGAHNAAVEHAHGRQVLVRVLLLAAAVVVLVLLVLEQELLLDAALLLVFVVVVV